MAEFDISSLPSNNSYNYGKEPKAVKKVIEGKAVVKKKSGMSKLTNAFFAEDVYMIKSYIFWDVLIPMIKDGISDIVKNAVDLALYGKMAKVGKKDGYTNYSNVSYKSSSSSIRKEAATTTKSIPDESIILSSRGDAELVLDSLRDMIDRGQYASVADMYELIGESTPFTANNYGWKNLKDAKIVRVREGFLLAMPKTVELD